MGPGGAAAAQGAARRERGPGGERPRAPAAGRGRGGLPAAVPGLGPGAAAQRHRRRLPHPWQAPQVRLLRGAGRGGDAQGQGLGGDLHAAPHRGGARLPGPRHPPRRPAVLQLRQPRAGGGAGPRPHRDGGWGVAEAPGESTDWATSGHLRPVVTNPPRSPPETSPPAERTAWSARTDPDRPSTDLAAVRPADGRHQDRRRRADRGGGLPRPDDREPPLHPGRRGGDGLAVRPPRQRPAVRAARPQRRRARLAALRGLRVREHAAADDAEGGRSRRGEERLHLRRLRRRGRRRALLRGGGRHARRPRPRAEPVPRPAAGRPRAQGREAHVRGRCAGKRGGRRRPGLPDGGGRPERGPGPGGDAAGARGRGGAGVPAVRAPHPRRGRAAPRLGRPCDGARHPVFRTVGRRRAGDLRHPPHAQARRGVRRAVRPVRGRGDLRLPPPHPEPHLHAGAS